MPGQPIQDEPLEGVEEALDRLKLPGKLMLPPGRVPGGFQAPDDRSMAAGGRTPGSPPASSRLPSFSSRESRVKTMRRLGARSVKEEIEMTGGGQST